MAEFSFPWESAAPSKTSNAAPAASASSSRPRRSSILKPPSSCLPMPMPMARQALADVDPNVQTQQSEETEDLTAAMMTENFGKSRRSSKRVSFSASKQVKEFYVQPASKASESAVAPSTSAATTAASSSDSSCASGVSGIGHTTVWNETYEEEHNRQVNWMTPQVC